jgi:phosphoribosylformylglycinamidine cyclo-ligase
MRIRLGWDGRLANLEMNLMEKATYSSAGVDVKKVRKIQQELIDMSATTGNEFTANVPVLKGHYAGVFSIGEHMLAMHCDGVGSKVLVAQEMGKYDTVGIDAVAMNVNDIVCIGARPVACVDYLAIAREDGKIISQIMNGVVDGCKQSGCALVGGETAILPDMISGKSYPFDLAVTAVGLVAKEKFLTGSSMMPGDIIIGLESSGLHSNGYTLARKLLPAKEWGKEMLIPTRIYVPAIMEMLEKCDVHGLAHITGGAFSKLSRIGAYAKVGFLLDSMPVPSEIFAELAKQVKSDYEMFRTFNMGIGMCAVVSEEDAEAIITIAAKHSMRAHRIGKTTAGSDVILQKAGKKISLL